MKLFLKDTPGFFKRRLHAVCYETPCYETSWHYHPQYELLYISKSKGIRFVGDNVSHFSPGDLVLVGSNLPHLWRNNAPCNQNEGNEKYEVKTVVMKFLKNFIGEDTFENPEFFAIKKMLELSKFGLSFGKKTSKKLHKDLIEIIHLSPVEQSIQLLKLLHYLSLTDDKEVLSSTDMRQYSQEPTDRLDAVIKYISDHYVKEIHLQEVADIACMTTNSFCRFFKKKTNKSFTQFLNEVRIRNASRLLLQDDISASEVCYKVGYQSITNFYKQFKQITGSTPKAYRQAN